MKQVKATERMLKKYLGKHGKALYCSRCERRIEENELVFVTTHHINYYCSGCLRIMEM